MIPNQDTEYEHVDCGNKVYKNWTNWRCAKCQCEWSIKRIYGMSPVTFGDHFRPAPIRHPGDFVLVWKNDPLAKKRFSTIVTAIEAVGLERVKF